MLSMLRCFAASRTQEIIDAASMIQPTMMRPMTTMRPGPPPLVGGHGVPDALAVQFTFVAVIIGIIAGMTVVILCIVLLHRADGP